jgi:hypothetical protein
MLPNESAFIVNALIDDGVAWQLAPVKREQQQFEFHSPGCGGDLATHFAIETNWYSSSGIVTLLVSPL